MHHDRVIIRGGWKSQELSSWYVSTYAFQAQQVNAILGTSLATRSDKGKLWARKYMIEESDRYLLSFKIEPIDSDSNIVCDIEVEDDHSFATIVGSAHNCHYVERDHARLQDILLCIATNQKVDAKDRKFKFEGDSYYIRSKDEMQDAFLHSYGIEIAPYLSNSIHFAERCEHAGYIDQKEFRLPRFQVPQGREWEEFKAWIRAKEDRKRERYGDELINKVLNS